MRNLVLKRLVAVDSRAGTCEFTLRSCIVGVSSEKVSMVQLLLISHVAFGSVALLSSTLSVLSVIAKMPHRVHVVAGIAFVISMIGISFTAIPLTLIHPNLFLRLIAIFSLYLALSGWRMAKNRTGVPNLADKVLVWGMTVTGVGMVGTGVWLITQSSSMGIVMIAFGAIAVALSQAHRRSLVPERRDHRILMHLTLMLAGTVAAWTALTVTQISYDPPWIPWLAPTMIFVPIIVAMRRMERRKIAKKTVAS
jgi:hypothetical protein